MHKRRIFSSLLSLIVFALLLIPFNVNAAEDGPLNNIAGAPGSLIGSLPPIPGLFLVSQTAYTTSRGLFDADGDEIGDFNMDVWSETFRILATYPTKIFGANIHSQLVLPFVSVDEDFSYSPSPFFSIDVDDSASGLANVTVSPLILNWHKGYSHYTLGFDITLKGFDYDEEDPVNVATGYNSYTPVVAYRYDDPNGLDLGIKASFLFNQKNSDTNYKTGNILMLDMFAGWDFGKWQVGVVGGYTQQVSDDKQGGAKISDHKTKTLTVGPCLTYNFGPIMAELNYQRGLIAENASKNDSVWLNITLPLYVPSMMH